MNVRMMTRVVKRGVPLQVVEVYLMRFRDRRSVPADELFPCVGIVIAKPFRVLTAQTQHVSPYHTVVIVDFIRGLIEVDFVVRLRKQTVCAELFH